MSDITTNESEEAVYAVTSLQEPQGESLTFMESQILDFISRSPEHRSTRLSINNSMSVWSQLHSTRRISNALARLTESHAVIPVRNVDNAAMLKLQNQFAGQEQKMQELATQVGAILRVVESINGVEANKEVEANPAPLTEAQLDFLEEQIPVWAEGALNAAFLNTLAQGHSAMVARDGEMVEVSPDGTVTKKGEMPRGGNLPAGTFIAFP